MFGILTRWRERRLRKKRELFRFFDGTRFRYLDPWHCYRKLVFHEHFGELASDECCQLASEGLEPHCSNALQAIIDSFGLKRLDADGNGMTDEEIFQFFADLNEYLEGLKKKQSSGLTSPSAMEEPSWDATEPHRSTTNSPLDSGSCSPESGTAELAPSCEPSTSH